MLLSILQGDLCFSRADTGELLEAPTLNVVFLHPHPAFSSQVNEPERADEGVLLELLLETCP